MLRRMSRKAVETLEFRSVLVVLAIVAAAILYFSLFAGHRPPLEDTRGLPPIPPGEQPPPARL